MDFKRRNKSVQLNEISIVWWYTLYWLLLVEKVTPKFLCPLGHSSIKVSRTLFSKRILYRCLKIFNFLHFVICSPHILWNIEISSVFSRYYHQTSNVIYLSYVNILFIRQYRPLHICIRIFKTSVPIQNCFSLRFKIDELSSIDN